MNGDDCRRHVSVGTQPHVPAVSEWGMIVMTLLVMIAGTGGSPKRVGLVNPSAHLSYRNDGAPAPTPLQSPLGKGEARNASVHEDRLCYRPITLTLQV